MKKNKYVPEHAKFDQEIFEIIKQLDYGFITSFGNDYSSVRAITSHAQSVAHRTNPPISTRLCSYCNKQAESYHHPDYTIPEAVIPVCDDCHAALHHCIINHRGEWIDENYYWNN